MIVHKEHEGIYYTLASLTYASVKNIDNWAKAVLYIKRLDRNVGFESTYITMEGKEVPVDTEADYTASKAVHQLHKLTTSMGDGSTKWNRAKFVLFPDNKIEMEYIWDQALQDKLDRQDKQSL